MAEQVLQTYRTKLTGYLSESAQRLAILQSAGLSVTVMLASYVYGRINYTPEHCYYPQIPGSRFLDYSPANCQTIPAVIAYPVPWISMLLTGVVVTLVIGFVAATLHHSTFTRNLLAGWFAFCAVVAVVQYSTYSSLGQPTGRYLLVYPATTFVAIGVAVACAAAIANIVRRARARE